MKASTAPSRVFRLLLSVLLVVHWGSRVFCVSCLLIVVSSCLISHTSILLLDRILPHQHVTDRIQQVFHILDGDKCHGSERLVDILGTCDISHGLLESIVHAFEEFAVEILDFVLEMTNGMDVGKLPVFVDHDREHLIVLLHDVVCGFDRHSEVLQLGQIRERAEHEHVASTSFPVGVVLDRSEGTLQSIGNVSHSQSDPHDAEVGHLLRNLGKDRGPTLDVLLLPDVVGSIVRNAVSAHMDVQSGDTGKVSVGDGLEEASQALSVVEVEDSCAIEDWTSLRIDRSAGEKQTVERSLPDDTFNGLRLLAGNAIVRNASRLHSLAANIFRCLLGRFDDSQRLDGLGAVGLTILGDSIEKRASLLVRPSIVLLDGDETLMEEIAIDLVANLNGKTKNAWE